MSMSPEDVKAFMNAEYDFGLKPSPVELTDDQKRLSALAMAMNAALVQFIQEGLLPYEQQMHFMGHLQDFADRLYHGESIKMPDTKQTLQVNSEAGNLFYQASLEALDHGSKTWDKIKELTRQAEQRGDAQDNNAQQEQVNVSKPTFH